jgi:uncharacterized membrane protein YczE
VRVVREKLLPFSQTTQELILGSFFTLSLFLLPLIIRLFVSNPISVGSFEEVVLIFSQKRSTEIFFVRKSGDKDNRR